MKGDIMAGLPPLADQLQRAAPILKHLGDLARGLWDNHTEPGEESRKRVAAAWEALRPAIIEVGGSFPPEPKPLADWVRAVARMSKSFDTQVRQLGLAEVLFSVNCDGFIRLAERGRTLYTELTAKCDPFAFAEESTEDHARSDQVLPKHYWSIESYHQGKDYYDARGLPFNPYLPANSPAAYHHMVQEKLRKDREAEHPTELPGGPLEFLESIRDEVHGAADAKRLRIAKGYSNDTLASMVRGIKWAEARTRVNELPELPADIVGRVARVLQRELTIRTVEQIDERLTPEMQTLRDAWENRDLPPKSSPPINPESIESETEPLESDSEPAETASQPTSKSNRRTRQAAPPKESDATARLLDVFTGGLADARIGKAEAILRNDMLTTNDKLTKIDAVLPFPFTASAMRLGKLLGVSKQAVMKTEWWNQHRKGEKASEIGRRHERHRDRGDQYEPDRPADDLE